MANPRYLQRVHFSPGAKPGAGNARPAIVQYHPQAKSESAKRQGPVLAFVEAWAVEHGPSLAAGPAALDLLSRILANLDGTQTPGTFAALMYEARVLLQRATPPEGSVLPNGTPDTHRDPDHDVRKGAK